MAVASRTVFNATEDGTAISTTLWWIPWAYRHTPSPYFDTIEDCIGWCEERIQEALDYIATIPVNDPGYGQYKPPRYTVYTITEVRDANGSTAFVNATY